MIEKIHESSLLLFVFLFRPNSQMNCKIILFEIRILRWWKSYSLFALSAYSYYARDVQHWMRAIGLFRNLDWKFGPVESRNIKRHIISLNLNPEKNCSPSKCSRNKRYCDQNWNFFFKSQFRHEMSQTAFLIL